MNCTRLKRLLSAYIDGELSGSDMLAAREHLHYCASCQGELDEVRSVKGAVARLAPVAASPYLEQRLLSAIGACEIPLSQRIKSYIQDRVRMKFEPAMAAIAACAGMFLLALGNLPQAPVAQLPGQTVVMAGYSGPVQVSPGFVRVTSPEALAATSRSGMTALDGTSSPAAHTLGVQQLVPGTQGTLQVTPVAYAGVFDR